MPFIFHCEEIVRRKAFFRSKEDYYFALMGSLAPDLEWFGVLKGAHWKSGRFLKYMLKNKKRREYAAFALGMHIHCLTDQYLEPAYINKKEIQAIARNLIRKYNAQNPEHPDIEHRFVEFIIDLNSVSSHKGMITELKKAQKFLFEKKRFNKISKYMADYFKVSLPELRNKWQVFHPEKGIARVGLDNFKSADGAAYIWRDINFYFSNISLFKDPAYTRIFFKYILYRLFHGTRKVRQMFDEARKHIKGYRRIVKKSAPTIDRQIRIFADKIEGRSTDFLERLNKKKKEIKDLFKKF